MLSSQKYKLIKIFKKSFNFFNLEIDKLSPRSNPELQVARILEKMQIDLVVDIGANEGQFASEIIYFGYKGKILSFEPLSSAYSRLLGSSANTSSWEVYPRCAIGDHDGEIEINISNYSVSSSILPITKLHLNAEPRSKTIGKEKVKIYKLDSIIFPYIESSKNAFLKIDTQGFEWQVLNGCEKSLSSFKGILCELSLQPLYESQHLWLEIIERLRNNGFYLYAIQPGFTDPSSGQTLQINGIFLNKSFPHQ